MANYEIIDLHKSGVSFHTSTIQNYILYGLAKFQTTKSAIYVIKSYFTYTYISKKIK